MRTSLVVTLLIATTAAPSGAADLYAAGTTLFRIDPGAGDVRARTELDAQATDLAVDPGGRYLAATSASGLSLHDPESLAPIGRVGLGVLDAVETSVTGDTLYVLLHPGSDRRRPTGAHHILALPYDELEASRSIASLGSESYDFFLSPDGRTLAVTRLVGRRIDVVDVPTGRVGTLDVSDGTERPEIVVVRSLAFTGPRTLVAGESAKTRSLVLWEVDLDGEAATAHESTWRMHAADVLVRNGRVIVNGRDQLASFDLSRFRPLDRRDVPLDAWHAVVDPSGTVYLAAPAEDGARILVHTAEGEPRDPIRLPARAVRLALAIPTPGSP